MSRATTREPDFLKDNPWWNEIEVNGRTQGGLKFIRLLWRPDHPSDSLHAV